MKILVAVKRVVDANVKVRVKADNSGVDLSNAKMAINPFCEIAIEEAIRIKEKGQADEVIAVSIGEKPCQEQIRTALALGADRGILVETEADLDSDAVARVLAEVIRREQPDLVIMGKQAIDSDRNQAGQMLAAHLDYPQATFAYSIKVDGGYAVVGREVDGGTSTKRVKLPAIITADLRLNEPRYTSLPGIIKAKRKQLDTLTPEELGVDIASRVNVVQYETPPARAAGQIVGSVDELVQKLRGEAKVI